MTPTIPRYIGLNRDHPQASNALNWRGRNLRGFAPMEERAQLTQDQARCAPAKRLV
ncbi:hypothetical protein D779_2956 [Imhoffiella purpurea]|uniref:Uncharacterized protein n=2 Tax=Imhoffiella purpurea TaxID=1249627 RepID=W9VDM4_9GAMM|nr:hypothetical protein D779_2956 [Imhoffiella purpurea]